METKIKLPQSWNDVKIEQWQEIDGIQSDNEVSKFIETLSILADTDPEEFRQLPIQDYRKVKETVQFLSEPVKPEVKLKIEIDGKKYGMIPDLNFITAGEWMDAETWKDKSAENIHLYCAMLYRPITKEDGDTYEIEPHKPAGFMQRAELFRRRLPITTVYGAVLFFSSLGVTLMNSIVDYLEATMKEGKKETTKTKIIPRATRKKRK
jgi:hypothetical protein